MTVVFGLERWPNEITVLLNAAFRADGFQIDIAMIAAEY